MSVTRRAVSGPEGTPPSTAYVKVATFTPPPATIVTWTLDVAMGSVGSLTVGSTLPEPVPVWLTAEKTCGRHRGNGRSPLSDWPLQFTST